MIRIFLSIFLLLIVESSIVSPTIEIKSVDMDIMTGASIDCSKFEQAFKSNGIRIKKIERRRAVDKFLSEVKLLSVFEDKTDTDTRAIILLKYEDHVDTICADRFSLCSNGTCYALTNKLRRTIW